MSRAIEFGQDQIAIKLSGITSVAALKRHVEVPYALIKKVSIEDFDVPLFTSELVLQYQASKKVVFL